MSANTIKQLNSSVLSACSNWDLDSQKQLAGLKPPELLMGVRSVLLQGDITREWCKWLIEQFIDTDFIKKKSSFPMIYSEVKINLEQLVGQQLDADDVQAVAQHLSNQVIFRLKQLDDESRKRIPVTTSIKETLLDIYGSSPRCWLTGYKFTDEAIFNFTAKSEDKVKLNLPSFVDRCRPIGINERDIAIEIDHLHPFSLGGDNDISNYRLICGWANKVKSNHISGYSYGTKVTGRQKLYPKSYYYWVVRLIGLKRACEVSGCKNDINNSELTVCSSLGPTKMITPASMKVVCLKHDNLQDRYIKREDFLS